MTLCDDWQELCLRWDKFYAKDWFHEMKIKFLQFCLVGQATFLVSLNSMLPRVRIADNTLKIICCFAVSTPITSSAVWNKIVSHVFSVVFLYHFNWVSHINLASSYRKHYLIKKSPFGRKPCFSLFLPHRKSKNSCAILHKVCRTFLSTHPCC